MLKVAHSLFEDEEERKAFIDAILAGESKEQAIIVLDDRPEIRTFPRLGAYEWQPEFVLRLNDDFRPGRHPLHEKGAYYCLDLSSVFCASAMLAVPGPIVTALDLCSAPGGKAVFTWRAHRPELLACNEAIRKRASTLIANLERCKVETGVVWSADPSVWARKFPETFDLIVVDAPCSGQSLLAKGDEAEGCWSPQMIDMCVGRQRRIVGHAAKCLRPGGHLLYSTCTYGKHENEKVIAWLLEQYDWLEVVVVPNLESHRSPYAEFPCYRLFPHRGEGAGGFACLLRAKGEPEAHRPSLESLTGWWKYGDYREPAPEPERPEAKPEPFRKPRGHRPPAKKVYKRKPKPKPGGRRGRGRP